MKDVTDYFINLVKEKVCLYVNEHLDKTDGVLLHPSQVYIVWYCKTLQNWKALASTSLPDGMYYELTLDGDRHALYLDAYKKFQNVCMPLT